VREGPGEPSGRAAVAVASHSGWSVANCSARSRYWPQLGSVVSAAIVTDRLGRGRRGGAGRSSTRACRAGVRASSTALTRSSAEAGSAWTRRASSPRTRSGFVRPRTSASHSDEPYRPTSSSTPGLCRRLSCASLNWLSSTNSGSARSRSTFGNCSGVNRASREARAVGPVRGVPSGPWGSAKRASAASTAGSPRSGARFSASPPRFARSCADARPLTTRPVPSPSQPCSAWIWEAGRPASISLATCPGVRPVSVSPAVRPSPYCRTAAIARAARAESPDSAARAASCSSARSSPTRLVAARAGAGTSAGRPAPEPPAEPDSGVSGVAADGATPPDPPPAPTSALGEARRAPAKSGGMPSEACVPKRSRKSPW